MTEEDELTQEEQDEGLGEEEHDDSSRAVASSMVASWSYDRQNQQIVIDFLSGHINSYPCSPSQWEDANNAPSPGRFVHENFL